LWVLEMEASAAIEAAVASLENLLEDAKLQNVSAPEVPGKMFLPAVAVYKEMFEILDVDTVEEFEEKIETDQKAEECNKKLKFLEEKWNKYLDTVDIAAKESVVANIMEESIVDQPVNLVSVGSGTSTNLESLMQSSSSDYLHLVLLRYLS